MSKIIFIIKIYPWVIGFVLLTIMELPIIVWIKKKS